ncbi:MAG: RdgB/HAM1 family non-canonical purine NTP pyrophosphatase [Ferruginibacter sp.]
MSLPTIVFASNNQHKANEIRAVLKDILDIQTLREAGILIDIPEPHDTLEENASEKSGVIYTLTGKDCFSEDTGLEVEALEGEPGVKSARYADNEPQYKSNIEKLLSRMNAVAERTARFRTVISLRLGNEEYFFEGICNGRITEEEKGEGGFGYDPVFIPDGAGKTFAEMTMDEKNVYSHRKKATQKFVQFLKEHYGKS